MTKEERKLAKMAVMGRSKMTNEEKEEERDEANTRTRNRIQKNIDLLKGDVNNAVASNQAQELSFNEFKRIIGKPDKTSIDIRNLIYYAQAHKTDVNKYLNRNNYKGATTIEELIKIIQENKPSQKKINTKKSTESWYTSYRI